MFVMSASPRVPPVPAVLRLVQTAVLGRWRATSEDLYREVVRLIEGAPGMEILVSGCGEGVETEWLAMRTGASLSGVDPDAESIERAEEHARSFDPPLHLHYQNAPLDDLPHETGVFDVAIGQPALSAAADPERAVSELVRVTKPMGKVLLLQPTWTSEIPADAREATVERLGMRPHLLVEWKQMLRVAGIVEVQVQDWTSGAPGRLRTTGAVPVQPALSWREKMHIAGRTWRRWGWRAAKAAVAREAALLQELSRERSIGFQLIRGVKWPYPKAI